MTAAARWAAIDGDATDAPAVKDMGINYSWPELGEACGNMGLSVQLYWPAVPRPQMDGPPAGDVYSPAASPREPRHREVASAEPRPDAVVHPYPNMVAPEATMDAHEYRSRREERRLANSSRQAAMAATPDELVDLNRVIAATEQGVISLDDARSAVSQLRRNQQARRAA